MLKVSDEQLEFWGNVYVGLPAGARRRWSFERFLAVKTRQHYLRELLPERADVRRQADLLVLRRLSSVRLAEERRWEAGER